MTNPIKSSEPADVPPPLSIVIGIRNWGLDRLQIALRSHRASDIHDLEIVISDYGSANCDDVFRIAETYDCKYIYSKAEVWSRSAALNAGIAKASSDNILTTDADIIFAPKSHGILLENLRQMPDSVQIIQCRDLPEGFGSDNLSQFDWHQLFQVSSIRPRWGMGGSATFKRDIFARIHGFDERMTVWGGEDNDFVQRARRSGAILNWIGDPEALIYHIWHAPDSRGTSSAGVKVVESNKKILQEDRTMVRNLSRSYRSATSSVPTVSIVIATKNQPDLLRESVSSCLRQTFEDFEIIVVDDGSTPELRPSLDDLDDPRLKVLLLKDSRGLAFARNYANAMARGEFIAIHDDDNLMLPQRLDRQLSAIVDDCAGSYGGYIDFDETGALTSNPGRTTFDFASMMFRSPLAHGTVLIRRRVLEFYRYNDNFGANSSHDLLTRIARGGVSLAHCGRHVVLRRRHTHKSAEAHSSLQKSVSGISKTMARSALSANLDQQYLKASRANPEADIPLCDFIEAAGHLPSRLMSKRMKIEFGENLPVSRNISAMLASILSDYREINIAFGTTAHKGIKAVTITAPDEASRGKIMSALSGAGPVKGVNEIMLPTVYPNLTMLEAAFKAKTHAERADIDVGTDIEGVLHVLEKHSSCCFLSVNEESGYRLGLPPLDGPVKALLCAKLRRFGPNECLDAGE
ncbi:glycosyltransferase family 2 protein [Microvirga terrestris]|uniref:Glycosyltransferase n=1 Tax=Microvirga terrestris TaxID=2791024 RepID=A0ABS0HPD0_9HYPH|nr:glycosyltransferase [Microvirga terrestris]MBF9195338.1 glycosyltransferase [Microvirga terrestris]